MLEWTKRDFKANILTKLNELKQNMTSMNKNLKRERINLSREKQ